MYSNSQLLAHVTIRVFVCIVYCRGKACIGPHFLFLEGSSLVNAKSFALRFFVYSPFSAPDTMCLIWTRLKRLQGIVRILKIGFSLKSNKYLQTSLEHAMNRACELSRPHASTRLCNWSLCVSMLCFETVLACITALITNCGPFNRRSSDYEYGGVNRGLSPTTFIASPTE